MGKIIAFVCLEVVGSLISACAYDAIIGKKENKLNQTINKLKTKFKNRKIEKEQIY